MQRHALWSAMLSAGLLAACGGGGDSPAPAPAPSTSASVSLSGVAAKGLMANADVSAHAVLSDGTVAADALATGTTDASGHYSLSFTATTNQPYVIKVTAKAGTTHLDEVSGTAQSLPAGFTMRAFVVPATSGTVTTSASVTPFSEMAVAAAAKATGGISATSAAQATSTVSQLIGFDPTTVVPASVSDATTANQQRLAVLLTAVSQLADSDALGCTTGTEGEKTQCVVNALASSASTTSIKLQTSSGTDVSAALGTAVNTVLSDTSLSGPVSAVLMGAVINNLDCTGTACNVASGGGGSDPVAAAIGAAKAMFAELRSDWTAMFSGDGITATSTGALNSQAYQFRQAMTGIQAPAEMLAKDVGALVMGIDLYNDYKSGRDTSNSRGRAPDMTANDGSSDFSNFNAVGCTLYQDSASSVPATAPANANFIGCRATYFVSRSTSGAATTTTEWRHGFTLTPNTDGTFGYGSRARQRISTCTGSSCVVTANNALQASAYSGTVTPTLTGTLGRVTGFTIAGELPGAFGAGTSALVSERHTWSFTGTRAIGADNMSTTTFSGNVAAFDAAGATLGTLTVKSGSSAEMPVSRDAFGNEVKPGSASAVSPFGGTLSALALNVAWTTAGAEFEGDFSMGSTVWDASGTAYAPTQLSLAGMLRTIAAGQTTEFVKGAFTGTTTGYAAYNATLADSATNNYTTQVNFTGTVSAPSRPSLQLSFGSAIRSDLEQASTVSLQYRSLVGTTPRMVIDATGTRRASDGKMVLTLTQSAANLSLAWVDGAESADLLFGTTKIGVVSKADRRVTFTDNSFESLDFGL